MKKNSTNEMRMVDLGFPTYDLDELKMGLSDWHSFELNVKLNNVAYEIKFSDVLAFKFGHYSDSPLRNDRIYEVKNSTWLDEQVELAINQGYIEFKKLKIDLNHYKVYFNGDNEVLEILCNKNVIVSSSHLG